MNKTVLVVSAILLAALIAVGGAMAQEKAPAAKQEQEKATAPAPAAVPAQKQTEEPKSLGVPVDAPKAMKDASMLKVDEAMLGSGVETRELVGEAKEFSLNDKVYLWLKLTGGPAEDLTVTWKGGGKSYETKLKVGGSPWRTWAYKTAAVAGAWTVTVTDAAGNNLKELTFTVSEGAAKAKE